MFSRLSPSKRLILTSLFLGSFACLSLTISALPLFGQTGLTATLTANGAHDLVVGVGTTINYTWSSAGAMSATSSYTVDGAGPYSWVANSLNGNTSATVAASQAGHSYVITYAVTDSSGKTVADQITITVASGLSALLTANGAHNLVVGAGDTIHYNWSSANAATATSSYTINCAGPSPWVANGLSGNTSATADASQAGNTYIITYTVTDPSGNKVSDQITVTVANDVSALLTANGTHNLIVGAGDTIHYNWSSANAATATSSYTVDGAGPYPWVASSLSGSTSGVVAPSQVGHAYIITYMGTDSSGRRLSDQITVTVASGPWATLTANGEHNLVVGPGTAINYKWSAANAATVTSSYTIDGAGPYPWVANNLSGSTYGIVGASQAGHTYTITMTVTDSSGKTESDQVTVTVQTSAVQSCLLPSITREPTAALVNSGQTASFNVLTGGAGTGTLAYQWYRNGAPIPGATTSSYMTPATTTSNNGDGYSVAVTSAAGTVNSRSAKLSVVVGTGNPIIASQVWANAAVSSVNGGIPELVQASNATLFNGAPAGAMIRAARSSAVPQPNDTTTTISCAQFSPSGFNGSGSVSLVTTVDPTTGAFSTQETYNACTWTDGVGPYVYDTFRYDGTESTTGSFSGATFQSSGSWNLTITETTCCLLDQSPETTSYTVTGSYSCTSNGSSISCSYDLGNYAISGTLSVTTTGNTTTVAQASTSTTVAGSSGSVDMGYSNWVYDDSLGYATSGTVTMTDSNGDTATITANGNGSYTVLDVINGVSSTYVVTP